MAWLWSGTAAPKSGLLAPESTLELGEFAIVVDDRRRIEWSVVLTQARCGGSRLMHKRCYRSRPHLRRGAILAAGRLRLGSGLLCVALPPSDGLEKLALSCASKAQAFDLRLCGLDLPQARLFAVKRQGNHQVTIDSSECLSGGDFNKKRLFNKR